MSNLSVSGEDEKWNNGTCSVCLVAQCRQDLTKFIRGTAHDGNLYFYVTCFEKKTNVESEYCFKLSEVDFLKFIDVLNVVDLS